MGSSSHYVDWLLQRAILHTQFTTVQKRSFWDYIPVALLKLDWTRYCSMVRSVRPSSCYNFWIGRDVKFCFSSMEDKFITTEMWGFRFPLQKDIMLHWRKRCQNAMTLAEVGPVVSLHIQQFQNSKACECTAFLSHPWRHIWTDFALYSETGATLYNFTINLWQKHERQFSFRAKKFPSSVDQTKVYVNFKCQAKTKAR